MALLLCLALVACGGDGDDTTLLGGDSVDIPDGKWVTLDVVCDVEAKLSYIFVDGKPIGSVGTLDYGDAGYGDAFTFRFGDVVDFGTKFDNFKVRAMTAD